MRRVKIGVLASGSGTNLQAILDNIDQGKVNGEVVTVGSDNPDAYALERARAKGIHTFLLQPRSFENKTQYETAIVKAFKEQQVELVVLAGYMRLVGETLLLAYPCKIINIHPALLPAFPGLDGQKQAFEYGVKYSGCTVHFVDAGMDTGPIIKQAIVPVYDNDTVDSLKARILIEEHKIFSEAIQLYIEGKLIIEGRKVKIKS